MSSFVFYMNLSQINSWKMNVPVLTVGLQLTVETFNKTTKAMKKKWLQLAHI